MHDEHACLKTESQMLNSEYMDTRKVFLRISKLEYLQETKRIHLIALQPAIFASSFHFRLITNRCGEF